MLSATLAVAACTVVLAAMSVLAPLAGPRGMLQAQAGDVLGACATPDSIAVRGNSRVDEEQIRTAAALQPGALSFPGIARAIKALYATRQFNTVAITCDLSAAPGRALLVLEVTERPVLGDVTVSGVQAVSERSVRDRVSVLIGRPLDPADVARSRARIDSLYEASGF